MIDKSVYTKAVPGHQIESCTNQLSTFSYRSCEGGCIYVVYVIQIGVV